eukprot:gene16148-12721_t
MFDLFAMLCAAGGSPFEFARWEGGGAMATARSRHGMGFFPDVGEARTVMVAGGYGGGGKYVASVELYDVAKEKWEGGTEMTTARSGHGMVFLPDVGEKGTVMVAGGFGDRTYLASVEFYDVAKEKWEGGTAMATARSDHGMVFLPDVGAMGAVMVAGGQGDGGYLASVELYDVVKEKWEGGTAMTTARGHHGMVFLPDAGGVGTVMVAGGYNSGPLASVELYDVVKEKWEGGTAMATARSDHGMVFLPDAGGVGTVMVAGGWYNGGRLASVELYDVAKEKWEGGTEMATARSGHGMVFLPDVGEKGAVMVAGGYDGRLASVELYDVANCTSTSLEPRTTTTATNTTTTGISAGGSAGIAVGVAAVVIAVALFVHSRASLKTPTAAAATLNTIPMLTNPKHRQSNSTITAATATSTLTTAANAPPYWSAPAQASCRVSGNLQFKEFAETRAMFSPCMQVVNRTYLRVATRDRHGQPLATRLKVVDVLRNENTSLWAKFAAKRRSCRRPGKHSLAADVNEFYLFHGTSPSGVNGIFNTGFRIDLAGSAAGTAFGNGSYFAECSSKSDEYAQEDANNVMTKGRFALLLCRVVCGNMRHVTPFDTIAHTKTKAPEHHSLLGDREAAAKTYREFIIERCDFDGFDTLYLLTFTQEATYAETLEESTYEEADPKRSSLYDKGFEFLPGAQSHALRDKRMSQKLDEDDLDV